MIGDVQLTTTGGHDEDEEEVWQGGGEANGCSTAARKTLSRLTFTFK